MVNNVGEESGGSREDTGCEHRVKGDDDCGAHIREQVGAQV